MRIPILLLFLTALALAQDDAGKPKLNPEIASLLDAARSVQPEYNADIVYRVLDSNRVREPELRAELFEELFSLGARVRHPVRLRAAGARTDTLSGKLAQALNTGLDGLSIQCRAVQLLLRSDPSRARELFGHIPPPIFPPAACAQTTVPDPSVYYLTAAIGSLLWFTPEERDEHEHIRWLIERIERIRSPVALARTDAMLLVPNPTDEESADLVAAMTAAVGRLSASDREFALAIERIQIAETFSRAVEAARSRGVPAQPLLAAVRQYFARQLGGVRCADTVESKRTADRINSAITQLVELGAERDAVLFEPFTEEEMEPEELLDAPEMGAFWAGDEAKSLLAGARSLRFGGGRKYLPLETRQTPEWQHEAQDFLIELNSWERKLTDDPAEHFHVKAGLYQALADLVPAGPLKQQALLGHLSFLASSPIQAEDPVQFLWQVQLLMDLARPMSEQDTRMIEERQKAGYQRPGLPGDSAEAILEAMRGSRNAVIALYGAAEAILPLKHHHWAQSWP